jgi:transketolase
MIHCVNHSTRCDGCAVHPHKKGFAVRGIERFGASAPGGTIMEKIGFTADNIVKKALEILK